jgi:hypothetical protein
MKEDLIKCLRIICDFPVIYLEENKTPNEIVVQSGYLTMYSQINEKEISEFIGDNQKLIENWLQFSDDQRHSPAWVFQKVTDLKWRVFLSDTKAEVRSELFFAKPNEACAKMIKMTVEGIRLRHGNR